MYANLQDVLNRLPLETVLYATDDEREGVVTDSVESRVTATLLESSSEADSYLAQRYITPVLSVPEVLKTKVLDVVVYRLLLRRGIRPGSADESLETQGKAALAWFRDVATGKASIPAPGLSTGDAGSSGAGKPHVKAADRVFSRDSLKDF
jgi:phage gp36-like protein